MLKLIGAVKKNWQVSDPVTRSPEKLRNLTGPSVSVGAVKSCQKIWQVSDPATRSPEKLRNLTGPSVSVRAVKKFDRLPKCANLKPWRTAESDRSICQVSDLSNLTEFWEGFREECPSELCPHALICQIWHLSDQINLFRRFLTICSFRIVVSLEGNKSILPFPPSPLLQLFWGGISFSIFAKGPDPRAKGVCGGDYP